jgi:N-acetylneuraminic acid mutarotase
MKKVPKLLVLAFFNACIITFVGCKKDNVESTAITMPVITTTAISGVTTNSAVTGGFVSSHGGSKILFQGVCWSTTHNPTLTDSITKDNLNSAPYFTSNLSGLTPNTTYYVRAYATNSEGTAYGNEISFTSKLVGEGLATLTTFSVAALLSTSAISGGNITSDGGDLVTARGICWGPNANPTISNNKTADGLAGIGYFTINLSGLDPGTNYYIRAYAVNRTGIAYGNEVTFTTPLTDPTGQKNYYPGGVRYSAASFSIGTKVYVGIGYNEGDIPIRDFWEWDQATNIWTRKADFPGDITGITVSFSIGTKGYIGTGNSFNTNGFTNEFWEYNPLTNSWTQKASLPTAPARAFAAGFSIGNKGYIGIGIMDDGFSDSYYQDFWEWDQTTNVWTKKADFPGNARKEAVGFSIGNKGYIGTGSNGTSLTKEFWEWDQATNVWTKKADFGGIERGSAVGFSIGSKGYIGTGYNYDVNTLSIFKDIWEWDQATNLWTRKADFGGGVRSSAVGVSIGNKGYIGTGNGGSIIYAYQDFWEYDPTLK